MASYNLVSSSPSAARPDIHTTRSSSPDLPSLGELISRYAKKPLLRSGSNTAPIPQDALSTFTSASTLWKSAQGDPAGQNGESKEKSQLRSPKQKPTQRTKSETYPKSKKPTSEEIIEISPNVSFVWSDKPLQSPDTLTTTSADHDSKTEVGGGESNPGETTPTKRQPWKMFKPPSPKDIGERSGAEGRVAKVVAPLRNGTGSSGRRAETVSRHFPPQLRSDITHKTLEIPKRETAAMEEIEQLPPAVARRSDWTPPRETATTIVSSDSSDLKEVVSPEDPHTPALSHRAAKRVFQTLQDAFGCPTIALDKREGRPEAEEMGPSSAGDKKANKDTAPVKTSKKKRPRTITELATAAYGGDLAALEKPDSRRCSEPKQGPQVVQGAHPATKPRKPDRTKKPRSGRQAILSPISAMRQSSAQDFVFGTSSQLAQEHSPAFLRDLHAALKASNELGEDGHTTRMVSPKKLWGAGARGDDGDLIEVEVIDLLESPAFPEDPMATVLAAFRGSPSKEGSTSSAERASAIDIDSSEPDITESKEGASPLGEVDLPSLAPPKPRYFATQRASPEPTPADTVVDYGTNDNEPPPSNQEASQLQEEIRISQLNDCPPNFELFTDMQLASHVANYGFKAVKNRSTMIALLHQCWASKNGRGMYGTGPRATMSTKSAVTAPLAKQTSSRASPKPPAAKRPRGRPKNSQGPPAASSLPEPALAKEVKRRPGRPKKTAAESTKTLSRKQASASMAPPTAPVPSTPKRKGRKPASKQPTPEIADSDMEGDDDMLGAASPNPSSSPDQIFSSPPTIDLSLNEDSELSLAVSPTSNQASIFAYITEAVKSAPRSTDPAQPSWHEKILMYDPVVLEDFTAWLNAGQLDRVGFDGEVSPFDAKGWCESQSVCCLWRVNLRGKERKRF